MTIIYGLGNNEKKYLDTKHNIGRIVVEELATKQGLSFSELKGCHLAKNSEFWLVYSNGYMNNSGQPLAELIKYYKVDLSKYFDLIIVQDDSDQIIGNSKLAIGGGSAGHNGIISVYQEMAFLGLSQENIWRLKISIRPEGNKLKSETFVLTKNSPEDLIIAKDIAGKIYNNFSLITSRSFEKLQKIINTKVKTQKVDIT